MPDTGTSNSVTPFRRELLFIGLLVLFNLALDVVLLAVKTTIDRANWYWQVRSPPPLFPCEASEGFVLGCLFSQVAALAIVTALLSGSHLRRILLGTLVLVGSLYFLLALITALPIHGYHLGVVHSPFGIHEDVLQWLFLVVVFYLVQIPLWILRVFLGLRLVNAKDDAAAEPRRQYSLGQIFGITAFIAFPAGLAAAILPMFSPSAFGARVLALAILSACFGLSYLWAILGTKRLLWGGLVALLFFSSLLAIIGALLYFKSLGPRWPGPRWVVWSAFLCLQFGTLVTALGNGLPARMLGYRLVWSGTR